MSRFTQIAWRGVGVGSGLLAAALIFSAGYTVSAFQHFASSGPAFTAEAAANSSLCISTPATISFGAGGKTLVEQRDELRRKLSAANARVSMLQKEIQNAQRGGRSCTFSPDVMRMLDDARRVDG